MSAWSTTETACERFLTRLGPFGLAALMLLAIFLPPIPSVHDGPLGHADAQVTPPPVNQSTVRSVDLFQYYNFKGNWRSNAADGSSYGDCGNTTMSGGPTYNELLKITDSNQDTGYESRIIAGQAGICTSDIATLQQAHNFTFPVPVNITSLRMVYLVGSADVPSYVWLLNASGGILGNLSLSTTPARTTSFLNGTFTNVKYFNWIANPAISVAFTEMRLFELSAWNDSNDTYPIEFAYADYLAARAQNDQITCNPSCSDFKTNNFSVPPGTGLYYSAVLRHSPCLPLISGPIAGAYSDAQRNVTCNSLLIPTSTSGDLTFELQGTSYMHRNNLTMAIWKYSNVANVNRQAYLQNASYSVGVTASPTCNDVGSVCIRFPNWYFQIGAAFAQCNVAVYPDNDCKPSAGTSTQPFGNATCNNNNNGVCSAPAAFKPMFGFGYKTNSGPFATISFPSMGWGGVQGLFDGKNISTVGAHPANTLDSGAFTIGLDNYKFTYVGNVVYLIMAKIANSNICDVTNATISVNGADAELAIQSFFLDTELGVFVQYCGWVLDDFMVVNGLNQSAAGENIYFDNSLQGRSYEIILPTNLRYTDWRAVQLFKGQHAARTSCNSDIGLCFGNYDTQGISVPGAKQTVLWRWNVKDQQTNESIEGAKAFEVISSSAGLTDASGNVNITTTTTSVQWSLTKQGYNAQYMNFSFLNQNTIYVNATMSKLNTKQFNSVDCNIAGNDTLLCSSNATSDVGDTCQELYGNDGTCRKGPVFGTGLKIIQFGCGVDGSKPTIKALDNVTAREANTEYGTTFGTDTFGLNNDISPMECLTASTTAVQTQVQDWTFSRPGFRTITFSANWLDKTIIKFVPVFKSGDGTATTVTVGVTNSTVIEGGVAKPASFITLTDAGGAEVSALGGGPAPGAGENFLDVCSVGGLGKDGCGFLASLFIFFIVLIAYFGIFKEAPEAIVLGAMGLPAFYFPVVLGMYTTPIIVLVSLGLLALTARKVMR